MICWAWLLATLTCAGAEISFEKDVRPILEAHCFTCHGSDKQKSGLRLDSPRAILKGGDSGEPLFVAGNSADSHVIKLVTEAVPGEFMPPKGKRLSANQIESLRLWIDQGASLPGGDAAAPEIESDHWSFQPLNISEPPLEAGRPGLTNGIDAFVFAKLKENGLSPSPPADKETLIRRLYLVAQGLPPTPGEVDAFVQDDDPDAYTNLIDAVLESPRYGERWARHWLDVVRYADTNGYETNRQRETAYHYRDYVIDSLNEDKPYDQFVIEQIAGDAVGADVATGFLVAGPHDIVKSPDINLTLMQRQDELADMVNTTGTAFLGVTLGCARCHNHKFDPVLQKDYYAMQAVFAGIHYGERPLARPAESEAAEKIATLSAQQDEMESELEKLRTLALTAKGKDKDVLQPPVKAEGNTERFAPRKAQFVRFTIKATNSGSEPCLDELEVYDLQGKNIARQATATASGTYAGSPLHRLEHINDGRPGNSHSWISNTNGKGWIQLALAEPTSINRIVWARDREKRYSDRLAIDYEIEISLDQKNWDTVAGSANREPFGGQENPHAFVELLEPEDATRARALIDELASLETQISNLKDGTKAWVANFSQPEVTHRLYRGDPMQKREPVAPDALTVTGSLGMELNEPEQQRRLKLARWIANKDNPLTARVLVNRLWHYIFGAGIVETPSDLGVNGARPTHPELLDWLAGEFIASGWSIKHMQRLILSSHTFQQSSEPRSEAATVDAGARYLWRFPPRRLEAEAIRDSILAVSGALDLTQGGPGFYLHHVEVENVMHYFPKADFGPPEFRRMVYLFKIRQEQDAIFGSFDCPDGNQVIPKRSRSNTPLQALNLFNSPFVLQQAEILTERLERECGDHVDKQIERAFHLFYSRPPDAFESRASAEMIRHQGLPAFCRALFNTSEFLFVF